MQENALTVRGRKENEPEQAGRFLHRGIAARSFERRYQLADYVQVESAAMNNGVLSIALKREVPESKKPHRIEIKSDAPAAVEHQNKVEKEPA
jgi:molecular chaperone IbpA